MTCYAVVWGAKKHYIDISEALPYFDVVLFKFRSRGDPICPKNPET